MWNNQPGAPPGMGRGFPPPPFNMPGPMGMPNPMLGPMGMGMPNPAFARGRGAPVNPGSRPIRRPNTVGNSEPIIPPNLEHLFAPRAPLHFIPPIEKKKPQPYSGLSDFLNFFESPEERARRIASEPKSETPQEKKERKKREKRERAEKKIQEQAANWDPKHDPNAKSDPRKTLFVGRLNYSTNEESLRRKMEQFGRVKRVYIVNNSETRKPRGYAFVEFEKERDMKDAYDHADGIKIDDKRIVVDYEKGRTEKDWKPRRLGGGLGGTRIGGKDVNQTHSGRKPPSEDHALQAPRDREREKHRGTRDGYRGGGERDKDYERDRKERYDDYERHGGSRHRPGHHR